MKEFLVHKTEDTIVDAGLGKVISEQGPLIQTGLWKINPTVLRTDFL